MSDDDDELMALGRRVDGQFRVVDDRVDATRHLLDVLQVELSGQPDAVRRDMGRLVLLWMWGSTVITAGMCVATIIVVLLVD